MFMRKIFVAAMAVMASVFLAVSANAVTLPPIGPNSALVVLGYPDDVDGLASIGPRNTMFTHTYEFQLLNSAASLNSFIFTGTTSTGFSTLTISLRNAVTNALIGSIDGLTSSTPVLVAGLTGGGFYNLVVSGKTTATGNSLYAFNVSAVPVPPALLLLVSGLFGAGFMGRRKRTASSVSV
jgi:hypothetical protein